MADAHMNADSMNEELARSALSNNASLIDAIEKMYANFPSYERMRGEVDGRLDDASVCCDTQPLDVRATCEEIEGILKPYQCYLSAVVETTSGYDMSRYIPGFEEFSDELEYNIMTLKRVAELRDRCERRILEMHPPTQ